MARKYLAPNFDVTVYKIADLITASTGPEETTKVDFGGGNKEDEIPWEDIINPKN